ncbi:ABC transporter ATP-binding protein [Antrihabitans sp. YC3-6]|uniref:ABC transporter ATP-binding protein n=1 Tax=Antrihabitans stalagmiti TaxID=2799499 RepID=A0A934U2J2_9NOCA|nr:ABC transporter ATP-binding protein [Antrihabitans stalagmiti]MBJ8338837.1 ABC transporter ATP-binding protein [Antrihabitans stalagmiti]
MGSNTTRSRAGSAILLRTITRNARRLSIGTALISLHQVSEALVPVVIGIIVDRAVETGDVSMLAIWLGALALLFAVLSTVYRLGARQLMLSIATEAHRLRVEVAAKILDPLGIRTELRSGDLLTVSTTDADNAAYLLDYVPRIVGAITAALVCAVTLVVIDAPLGFAVLVGTPVVLLALQLSAPAITRRVADQQAMAGRATSVATDLVSGLRPLRGIGAEAAATQRYRAVSQQSLRATLRAARTLGSYAGVSAALSSLLAVAIAIAAGWLALDGRISIGELITVIGLAQFLIEPFGLLAIVPSWVAEARASAERIADVTTAEPILADGVASVGAAPCSLELVGLTYGALDGVDLTVAASELVGVVTPAPTAGDSLVAVLSGRVARSDYGGEILLGGTPLHTIEHVQARKNLLVEPHDTDLFAGTVGSNVTVGAGPNVDERFVDRVLHASAAIHVVTVHSDGMSTVVAERGASLSGGQRQRVALARALLTQAPVLVLHEPTTAVDAVTEHAVAEGISSLRHRVGDGKGGGFTTILVTSSPALLAVTDRVVVLDSDGVVAEGKHADLARSDERYRRAVLR